MKNKSYLTTLIFSLILTLIFIISIFILNNQALKKYEYNNNLIINNILSHIKEEYPDFDDRKIITILNDENLKPNNSLKGYGIDLKKTMSLANQKVIKSTITLNIIIIITYILLIILIISLYKSHENKKIKQITNYIKEINNKNYKLDIISNTEDDLSLLKNEIYKTAVTLNEQAELLMNDKNTLKDSLSDISHQLKTPLTSINLMIETLLDNQNICESKKKEILNNIHRKISNINFLIYSLLKLSKFDANTITFKDESCKIEDIINEVIDNLSTIIDLKDIKVKVTGNKKDQLFCDFKWQVEALTNIIKNCLEYSNYSSKIDISYISNDLFTKIAIKDYGQGMDSEDTKHIFDRFYKGKNSTSESVGIGLALAKTIIEKDNGYISVESQKEKGTTFIIKYLK